MSEHQVLDKVGQDLQVGDSVVFGGASRNSTVVGTVTSIKTLGGVFLLRVLTLHNRRSGRYASEVVRYARP